MTWISRLLARFRCYRRRRYVRSLRRIMGPLSEHMRMLYRFGYTRAEIVVNTMVAAEVHLDSGEISRDLYDHIRDLYASGAIHATIWALDPKEGFIRGECPPDDVAQACHGEPIR